MKSTYARLSWVSRCTLLLLTACCVRSISLAQFESAAVLGTVVDPSAAPIPKAQFNASTVSVPTDVTPPYGNTVRNIGVSNAYYDLDFGLRKEFPIVREDWRLQFKAEFFKAFNKTDLSPARFPHAKFSLL